MCDTLVAVNNATIDGRVILAKNSDREPNEAQIVEYHPAQSFSDGQMLKCAFMSIPQASRTNAVLISRPFWMFGCEMGANEKGVVIGNEAVFTKEPYSKHGLTGMDLIRIALERTDTAEDAMDLIINLTDKYGQGGNAAMEGKLYYHNAYIIADFDGAWVLETAGKYYAAHRVQDVYSISNRLSITDNFEKSHPDLISHAIQENWVRSDKDFHFDEAYKDLIYSHFACGKDRRSQSYELLQNSHGKINAKTMMGFLRDHKSESQEFIPGKKPMKTLCMHAGSFISSQSTGSMVADLNRELPVIWITGTSAPCTSVFKPFFFKSGSLPNIGQAPTNTADDSSLWWRHENLHRTILQDFSHRLSLYADKRDDLEQSFIDGLEVLKNEKDTGSLDEQIERLAFYTEDCFKKADDLEQDWAERLPQEKIVNKGSLKFRMFWKKYNRKANFWV